MYGCYHLKSREKQQKVRKQDAGRTLTMFLEELVLHAAFEFRREEAPSCIVYVPTYMLVVYAFLYQISLYLVSLFHLFRPEHFSGLLNH